MPPYPRSAYTVSVDVAQQMVADSGLSYNEIAKRFGWTYVNKHNYGHVAGNVSALKRHIGLQDMVSRGTRTRKRALTYDQAARLCRVLGLDPIDYGL